MAALRETDTQGTPSTQVVRPNGVFTLIGIASLGSVIAGIVLSIMLEVLSPPNETPPDPFLGVTMFHVVMVYSVMFGAPVATVLALFTSRRSYLPHTTFVVGGSVFVSIGVLLPIFFSTEAPYPTWTGAISTAAVTVITMLYCKRKFPLQPTDINHDQIAAVPVMPKSISRSIKGAVFCIVIGYAAWGARPNQNKILVRAVDANDFEGVREAPSDGATLRYNPNYPNNPKALGSPIVTAIKSGNREMFYFLAEQGASIDNYSYQDHGSPLMCAARLGDTEIVRYLLGREVNLHWTGIEELSAYDLAVANEHHEAAQLIFAELMFEKSQAADEPAQPGAEKAE